MAPLCLRVTIHIGFFLLLLCSMVPLNSCSLVDKQAPSSSLTELWMLPASLSSILSTRKPTCVQEITERLLDPFCQHQLAQESLTCEEDLGGVGSLATKCVLTQDITLASDSVIAGAGTLEIKETISVSCEVAGCNLAILLEGDLNLGEKSSIRCGTLVVQAANVNLGDKSTFSTTALAGDPPPQTSGTPSGTDGAGGGHGGRGACCLKDETKEQGDTWGGDMYDWSTLHRPWSYGSKGGTTRSSEDLGGRGGGRVNVTVTGILVVDGSIEADGGSVGEDGGGGSGGSLYIKASRIKGNGQISASGGTGRGGGSGGRIAINCLRLDGVTVSIHGGNSLGCPKNAGAAGTRFDVFSQSLYVSNSNKTTGTDTLLLEFPNHPLWTAVIVEKSASVLVPLLWSRVQVRSMISLQSGGILSFGLAWFSSSEFELMAEEVLMSDSTIKVFLAPACCPSLLFLSCTLLFEHAGIQGSHLRFLQQKFLMYLCLLHLFPSLFFLGTSFFLSQVLRTQTDCAW
jgi:hypothetical protein